MEGKYDGAALADIRCDAEGVSNHMRKSVKQRQPEKIAGRKFLILLLMLMAVFILDLELLIASICGSSVSV